MAAASSGCRGVQEQAVKTRSTLQVRCISDSFAVSLVVPSHEAIATSEGESTVKTLTSILAAGAILAFAAQAGNAANAKHSTAKVGYGPYAYLGDTATAKRSTISIGWRGDAAVRQLLTNLRQP